MNVIIKTRSVLSIFIALLLFTYACKSPENSNFETQPNNVITNNKNKIEVYDFAHLEPLLHQNDDKIHVVNFWATWCAPCVKELPYFESLTQNQSNIDVLLVSMDFPNEVESRLIPFIKKKNIQSKVVLLDDSNENEWIPKVNQNWKGAIPVTIIYNKNKRNFYEQSFTLKELETEIAKFNN